ncbi:MAG: T9SS type A sorting domain-containing protein, partial [Ferruginibacter sp.]
IDVTAGVNGVCTGYANNAWGTTAGDQGLNLLSLKIPVDTVAFVDTCVILPVTVRSFTATVIENKSINLNWTVEEEVGIISYTIQRSESGSSGFISLGSLNSKRHEPGKTYSFIDWTAKPNTTYYYRLAILENTGQTKYSITRSAKMDKSDFFITAYPSPTRGLVKIQLSNFNGTANIKIVNNLGQMVFEKKVNENSSFTVTIDLTHQPKGNYWVNVRTDRGTTTKKIIKL